MVFKYLPCMVILWYSLNTLPIKCYGKVFCDISKKDHGTMYTSLHSHHNKKCLLLPVFIYLFILDGFQMVIQWYFDRPTILLLHFDTPNITMQYINQILKGPI